VLADPDGNLFCVVQKVDLEERREVASSTVSSIGSGSNHPVRGDEPAV
jgi:hypothetical protein